jgi:DNA-binding CsgD family transcriptional regulator
MHATSEYQLPQDLFTSVGREVQTARIPAARLHAEPAKLAELWHDLVRGDCKIESSLFDAESCGFVIVRRQHEGHSVPLPARYVEILERAALAAGQKSVAIEAGLAASSIATILKQCFKFMGLPCLPSRMPLTLVMAAYAWQRRELWASQSPRSEREPKPTREIIRVARPDVYLEERLSKAEYSVATLLVEGRSYAEMATLRQTSARTIANQLAAVFQRLRISGRAELLRLLAEQRAMVWNIAMTNDLHVCNSEPELNVFALNRPRTLQPPCLSHCARV